MDGWKRRWHLHDFFITGEMAALPGDLHDNTLHSHYALQLLFPFSESVRIESPDFVPRDESSPLHHRALPFGPSPRFAGRTHR